MNKHFEENSKQFYVVILTMKCSSQDAPKDYVKNIALKYGKYNPNKRIQIRSTEIAKNKLYHKIK